MNKHLQQLLQILQQGETLNELEKSGYNIVPEIARQIIKEQMAINGDGLPWKNIYSIAPCLKRGRSGIPDT